jgi:6-phosphogluconolactonase
MVKEFLFPDQNQLFTSLANNCQSHLQKSITTNGVASLMVSGGSTPVPLYEALAKSDMDWKNIHVALVDERWVDKEHNASNEALIYRSLLHSKAEKAPFMGMKNSTANAIAGCLETEAQYQKLPQPFTVTILGMGSDGHTASLFPHAEGLSEALAEDNQQLTAPIMAIQSEVTGVNTERVTLTLSGLLKSERLILIITGEEKLAVFREAISEGAVEDMPIRALLRQNKVPFELYWAP